MGTPIPTPTERALSNMDGALPSGAIRTDRETREAHAKDESEAEAVVPDAVVHVRSTAEVAAVLAAAHAHDVPVTPRAGGTGRTGGATCVAGGLVLAVEHFGGLDIDDEDYVAVAGPGVVLQDLHEAVEDVGLFYPPDPNSLASCRLGGNIAENAGGPRAFKYGVTRDYVLGLEIVTPGGTVMNVGRRTKKGVTGYDLTGLIVGSEGTLAVVTSATLHLIPKPAEVRTLLAFLSDEALIAPAVRACLRRGVMPRCVELLDGPTLAVLREDGGPIAIPEAARAMLLVEVDGAPEVVDRDLETLGGALDDEGALEVLVAKHGGDRERLWAVRRNMSRSLRARAKNKLSEDVVVPRSRLGDLFASVRAIGAEQRIRMPAYGHAGDGNLHVNFLWDTDEERLRVDAAIAALFERVIALGGTLSGEHGIGVLKAPFLPLEQSPAVIDLSMRIKAQFDPRGILNPGKVFPGPGVTPSHRAC